MRKLHPLDALATPLRRASCNPQVSRWAKPAPERTVGGGPEPEVKEIAFSEIKVTPLPRNPYP